MTDILLRRVSLALCLAGVGIAGYLTYVHYAGSAPDLRDIARLRDRADLELCEPGRDSGSAAGSDQLRAILITLRMRDERALLTGHGLTLIAFGFSAYLTYREVFTIHAICSWCVSSAIVFSLLAITGTIRAVRVGGEFVAGGRRGGLERPRGQAGRAQRLRARRCSARRRAGSRLAICCAKWLSATSPYCSTSPSTSDCALKAMY